MAYSQNVSGSFPQPYPGAAAIGEQRDEEKQPEHVRAWYKELDEQKAANEALHQAYLARVDEIHREGGIDAAEDAFDARVGEMSMVADRIFATPAHTLEGIMVKLRASDRMGLHTFADENDEFVSIAADIRRLAVGGVS